VPGDCSARRQPEPNLPDDELAEYAVVDAARFVSIVVAVLNTTERYRETKQLISLIIRLSEVFFSSPLAECLSFLI
jgi:hypothetical protein